MSSSLSSGAANVPHRPRSRYSKGRGLFALPEVAPALDTSTVAPLSHITVRGGGGRGGRRVSLTHTHTHTHTVRTQISGTGSQRSPPPLPLSLSQRRTRSAACPAPSTAHNNNNNRMNQFSKPVLLEIATFLVHIYIYIYMYTAFIHYMCKYNAWCSKCSDQTYCDSN